MTPGPAHLPYAQPQSLRQWLTDGPPNGLWVAYHNWFSLEVEAVIYYPNGQPR